PCLEILKRAFEKAGSSLDQRELAVNPLGSQEAYDLARMLLGRSDSASQAQAAAIARESGGNPFFVQVLAQSLGTGSAVAENPPLMGNLVLDEVLWARIETLPSEARRLLEAIAVLGQPLSLAEARKAAEMKSDERGPLAVLRAGRLIRSSGLAESEEVETYHDRVRETILSHLSAEVVKNLHYRIARSEETAVPAPNASGSKPI